MTRCDASKYPSQALFDDCRDPIWNFILNCLQENVYPSPLRMLASLRFQEIEVSFSLGILPATVRKILRICNIPKTHPAMPPSPSFSIYIPFHVSMTAFRFLFTTASLPKPPIDRCHRARRPERSALWIE